MTTFNCATCGTTLSAVETGGSQAAYCDVCQADGKVPASVVGFSSPSPTTAARTARLQWIGLPGDEDAPPKPRSIVNPSWSPWGLLLRLSPFLVMGTFIGWCLLQPTCTGDSKEDYDLNRTKMLTKACESYKINNGTWPSNLEVLAEQQANGARPLIEPESLQPWSGLQLKFKYDPTGPHNGGTKPDIWVNAPNGLIGNWMAKVPR